MKIASRREEGIESEKIKKNKRQNVISEKVTMKNKA